MRKKLKLHCLGLASLEQTIARLRSRVLYLKEGDANTSFFHQQAIDFAEIGIQQHDLSSLEVPFTEEEVWATVKEMPLDKAPGPDGFTGRFYKSCWNIIKEDIMLALLTIHRGHVSRFRLLNTAFISLLPKKQDALSVKDFRPISLIHSFAKLVTKIINRLAPLLPSLIPPNQSAFIKGRNIHDNFLFVRQMVKVLHDKKKAHILLKLDISKAFDSVSWPFLLEVLRHLGFGQRWCNLLCLILSTSST